MGFEKQRSTLFNIFRHLLKLTIHQLFKIIINRLIDNQKHNKIQLYSTLNGHEIRLCGDRIPAIKIPIYLKCVDNLCIGSGHQWSGEIAYSGRGLRSGDFPSWEVCG